MSATDPGGCFHVWPDGLHGSHTCLEDERHQGDHACTCGASVPTDSASSHEFLPVRGHPDDDECTFRSDGTDATYCGEPMSAHEPTDPSPACAICGDDAARYESNHGASGPFSVVPEPSDL